MAKPRSPESEKLARIVRWVIIVFFAYAFVHAFVKPAIEPGPATTATGKTTAPAAKDCNSDAHTFPAFALLPSITPQLHIQNETEGTGDAAVCGQTASIAYEYDTRKGEVIFSTQSLKKPVEDVRIGEGDLLSGLEQGIVGMKKGGERTLSIPPAQAFYYVPDIKALRHSDMFAIPSSLEIKNQLIISKVKLMGLAPATPSTPLPIRIIDTQFSSESRAACDDTVSIAFTIWKMDGTPIFSTTEKAPVTFTIGASQVPLGLEEGVMGMARGSKRLIIMPPGYFKPLDPHATPLAALDGIHWPENEIVLVEITGLSVVEKPADLKQK